MEKQPLTEQNEETNSAPSPMLTLDDLLVSESEVLKRIGRERLAQEAITAGHNSSTSGHNMSGTHQSHSMATSSDPNL